MNEKILELIRQGKTSKEIGKELFMSPRTVEKRLAKMREQYDCKKTIQLLQFIKKVEIILPTNQES